MSYITNSVFCRFVLYIVRSALNAYDNSVLKRCVGAVGICWQNSAVHSIIHRYIYKKPYFRYSLVYRIIQGLAHIVDRLCGFLHRLIAPAIKGSMLYALVNKVKGLGAGNITYLAGILLMSIPIGSIVAMIITDSVTLTNMVLCWVIFAVGMFVVLCGIYMTAFLSSIAVRAVKWLTDIMLG